MRDGSLFNHIKARLRTIAASVLAYLRHFGIRMDEPPDEGAKLEAVIARIQRRITSPLEFPDEKVASAAATLALLRIMIAHAQVVALVGAEAFAEASSANVRTMFEAWVEIYSILAPGSEEENARRCVVFGLLEFRDHSVASRTLSAEEEAQIEAEIAPYREKYPDLVANVEQQRTKKDPRNSNYWTGTGRGELIRRMEERGVASTLRSIYKMLSWDAHHVIAVALQTTIRTNESGSLEVGFHPLQLPEDTGAFNRTLAARMLIKAWLQVAKHLGIDPG